tara:strand:+ start:1877 stop:2242 length:366 start_codon:yes stop_codon:yes gene_type:complete
MYTLNISNYHDTFNKCYRKIITINNYPEGPLQKYVSRVANKKLSPFQQNTPCNPIKPCIYIINSISNTYYQNYMTIDEIPDLFHFLKCNNYVIDEKLNEIIVNSSVSFQDPLLCFVSYNKN